MKIAIGGKMGSGKTTTALYLADKYGFWRYAIADNLRDVASEVRLHQTISAVRMIQDMTNCYCEGIYLRIFRLCMECQGKSDRWLLQKLGTDIVRAYDEDVWIRCLLEQIGDRSFVVIDDVRFRNELEYLKDRDYVTIWINCDVRVDRLLERDGHIDGLNHSSEHELDESRFDYVMNNNGGLEDLYSQVDTIISESRCLYA